MVGGQDLLKVILTRRSVRDGFSDKLVPREVLDTIVQCALAAPSSKNAQPWRLHVVTGRSMLASMADSVVHARGVDEYVPHDPRTGRPYPHYVSTVVESAAVLRSVPAAIFVENRGVFSGGRRVLGAATPGRVRRALAGYGFELLGLGAAIENMWIAALCLGLSAVYIGDIVVAEGELARTLGIENDLLGALMLGYSDTVDLPPRRLDESGLVMWHSSATQDVP